MTSNPSTRGGGAADGRVTGRITIGDQPQAEAVVLIAQASADHPDMAALSNEAGRYQLDGLPAGWYVLEARLGDRSRRQRIELGAGEMAWVDFAFD